METVPLETLRVTNVDQFHALLGLIHDEWFDLDKLHHDREQGVVEIPYRRAFHAGPHRILKNRLLWKVIEVDVVRSLLRIHNVRDLDGEDTAGIGGSAFNTVTYDPGTGLLVFHCEPPLKLRMSVSSLLIETQHLEVRGGARITAGLWGDSRSSRTVQ